MNHNDTVAYHRAMLDEKEAGRRNQMARLVHEQEVIDLLKSELGATVIDDGSFDEPESMDKGGDQCECCGEISGVDNDGIVCSCYDKHCIRCCLKYEWCNNHVIRFFHCDECGQDRPAPFEIVVPRPSDPTDYCSVLSLCGDCGYDRYTGPRTGGGVASWDEWCDFVDDPTTPPMFIL